MLARAPLSKESLGKNAAKISSKPANGNEQFSTEPLRPEHEFTPPKFFWSIGKVAVSAPSDSGTNPGDDGGPVVSTTRGAPLPWPIQAKLEVGAVDDPLEREADRVAEQVMRMPEPAASTNSTTPAPSPVLRAGSREASDARVQRMCSCGGSCDKCRAEAAEDERGQIHRKPAVPHVSAIGSSPSATGMAAPPIVHEVVRSPGQSLDPATRTSFERRFGYDFSRVRISADTKAAESAENLRARSYTVGARIVFATGQYHPGTREGARLLAHELAHVVQQGNARHELAASATGSAAGSADYVRRNLTPVSHRVQRTPQKNWAGTFADDVYRAISEPKYDPPGYGAHIEISFLPNDKVDAGKIAFVQTAQVLLRESPGAYPTIHEPWYAKTEQERAVLGARTLQGDEDILGTHVDQPSTQRTPLYSMRDPSRAGAKTKSDSLAGSVPVKYSDYGYRTSAKGTKKAWIVDEPALTAKQEASGSALFESTALAVEGAQQGTYYGTVQWGFTKEFGETEAKLIPFQLSSDAAPSATFFEAAKLWNASKTTASELSLPLPISGNRFVKAATNLRSSPGKGEIAKLELNTTVEILDDSSKKDWVKVIVTGGAHSGKMGWLKAAEMATVRQIVPKHHKS